MGIQKPTSTISDVHVITMRGPWKSKSGGDLHVLFALPADKLAVFLDFDNPEFARIEQETGVNIRGLRSYSVSNIPKGAIGAAEWHRSRTEFVTALSGQALWQCVDSQGSEQTFELDGNTALIMPAGLLHTYKALEDGTRLQVICNNLFDPDDPRTHDSLSRDSFYELIGGTLPAPLT